MELYKSNQLKIYNSLTKNKEILQSSDFLQKLEQDMMKTSKQLIDYERKRSKYYSTRL